MSDPIRLGLLAPLTGIVDLYGPEISRAARIACDEVNEAGGLLGRPLDLIVLDDGSLPDSAVPAAEALVTDHHCAALIGTLLSNSRIAVVDRVAERHRVPLLNFSFYEGSIDSPCFFHFAALPNQQIARMIPYMAEQFGPKFFFAGSNYEWPLGSIDAARKALLAWGGEVVGERYLPLGAADPEALLDELARSGANVFVPYFAGAEQMRLLTRFTERGLKERMAVVMGHYDEAMVSRLPPAVRAGFYSSNTYFMSVESDENRAVLARLARQSGVTGLWPDGNGVLTHFGEGAYLCVHAFAHAAQAAGTLESEPLLAALARTAVTGPQGRVQMDPQTRHAAVNSYLARCRADGTFAIVEQFGLIPPEIPERYRPHHHPAPPPQPAAAPPPAPRERTFGVGVAMVSAEGRVSFVNNTLVRLLNYHRPTDLLGREAAGLWTDPGALDAALTALKQAGEWSGSLCARLADGGERRVEVTLEPVSHVSGSARCYTLTCVDPAVLAGPPLPDLRSQRILSVADIAVVATDRVGTIVQANQGASRLFGYAVDELVGLSVHVLLPPQYRQPHAQYLAWFAASPEREVPMGHRGEIAGYRKDGTQFPAEASLSKFEGPDGWVLVATLHGISTRKLAEEELHFKATHDPLTGLPNRALIRERLANALVRSRRYGHGTAVLFIDVDGFKLINDSYGHDVGDELLAAISRRLLELVRPGDTVARFGGDEYVVLCEKVEEAEAITELAERINEGLRQPFQLGGQPLFATASIGLAVGHGATHSAEDLLRNADAAMYSAKERGRDGWHIFNDEIHARTVQRLAVANGLRGAVQNDELAIRLQPIVDAASGRIRGAELLLRWFPPSGEVSPGVFIPVAEMTGSILPIGQWVFEQACRVEQRFRGLIDYISVNVSTRQLNDQLLVERFAETLARTGADPSRIVLEITETSLMADVESNLRVLRRLAARGLTVAVDDFGTGYSSLAQLLRLPVGTLKIDRVFVDGLGRSNESNAIVAAILGMAEALNLKVVAEGVETREQLTVLQALGCRQVQGFYFFRPLEEQVFAAQFEAAVA